MMTRETRPVGRAAQRGRAGGRIITAAARPEGLSGGLEHRKDHHQLRVKKTQFGLSKKEKERKNKARFQSQPCPAPPKLYT